MADSDATLAAQATEFAQVVGPIWQEVTLASRSHGGLPVLSPGQALALRLVTDNGQTTPTTLAEQMRLSRPVVSEVLKKLESQHLIERQRSHDDGRSVILTATQRGRYVRDSFRSGIDVAMAEAFESLPPRTVQQIMEALPSLQELQTELTRIADREKAALRHPDPNL